MLYYHPDFGVFCHPGGEDRVPAAIALPDRPSPYHVPNIIDGSFMGWVISSDIAKDALVAAVQSHLDAAARAAGYDDIKSAVTYADEPAVPKFQIEGQRFRAWRSLVWASCYAMLDDVLDNKRTVPTVDELLAELPVLEGEQWAIRTGIAWTIQDAKRGSAS